MSHMQGEYISNSCSIYIASERKSIHVFEHHRSHDDLLIG